VTDGSKMSQIQWVDKIINKNQIADYVRRVPGLAIMKFVGDIMKERQEQRATGTKVDVAEKLEEKRDFLTRYLDAREKTGLPMW
jgi:hypothetical protein